MPYREPVAGSSDDATRLRPRRRSTVAVWRRAAAATLDTLLMAVPVGLVWWVAASIVWPSSCDIREGFDEEQVLFDCNPWMLVLCWVMVLVTIASVAWLVTIRQWRRSRPTPGGRLFGPVVVDASTGDTPASWRCALRLVVRTVISPILGIGFLWMRWDVDGRTLHDLLARTAVVPRS